MCQVDLLASKHVTQDHHSQMTYTSPARGLPGHTSTISKPSPQSLPFVRLDTAVSRPSNLNNTLSAFPSPQLNPYDMPTNDVFFKTRATEFQPLQYHRYSSLPPNRKSMARNERTVHDFFINDALRETLQRKQAAALQTLPNSNLPMNLHFYHSLVPLDVHAEHSVRVFGYPSWTYKAMSKHDGCTYTLRRIEGFKLVNEASIGLVERWRKLVCANVVSVREAFTSKAFSDDSIIFVHEYHALSQTLYDVHYNRSSRKFSANAVIAEKLIWSYFTQLINGIRAIHSIGLACRILDSTKVLVTEKNRLRINCCGILDVIAYDGHNDIQHQQRMDIAMVGVLILGLALNDASAWPNAEAPFDLAKRGYSTELNDLLHRVLSDIDDGSSMPLDDVITAVARHSLTNLDAALCYNDTLESELGRETENGRLVRLLCKFGFINERPEFDHDSAWSETGERYVLKLFRDYVFHQVNDQGLPVVDMGHVLACLNKLDAGIDERLSLVSRDEQTCIIISYKELKKCAEQAFHALRAHSFSKNPR